VKGQLTDTQGLIVPAARISLSVAQPGGKSVEAATDELGNFAFLDVIPGEYVIAAQAKGFLSVSKNVSVSSAETVYVEIRFTQLAKHSSVVIVSSMLEPGIDLRNADIYSETLFERDDQMLESLGAGINAGQHEGGGKSLEIRRFGFNLDH